MKVSYNWLKDYLDFEEPASEIADILTDLGLEVSGVEHYQSIPGGLEGLVVGEVLEKSDHPGADRLVLTKVDIGNGTPVQIVCGAPNVATGQKVIVAPVGTAIHHINGDTLTMRKAKIRGEVSEGMICAEDEVGLGTGHDGIAVLNTDAKAGASVRDLFDVYEDEVIEIDLTPNRIDGASHYGVARDLQAYFQVKKANTSKLQAPDVSVFPETNAPSPISIEIEDAKACPRYAGLLIENVEVQPSPQWLQNRLKAIGQKPINNVVDITNYVLQEMNQPLHAFDADKIKDNKVQVKKLNKGTKFTTLDEVERTLHENDLMICDAQSPMCIAGVFGGVHSGVTNETKNVFLESAYFDPVHVRKTAKRHGLNTDASFRFERGVDPEITIKALKRAALLIQEFAGGEIKTDITDIYPNKIQPFEVELTHENCRKLIGEEIGKEQIKNILQALEINIESEEDKGLTLSVPAYRVDVQREVDVIEEILRVHGYNNIAVPEKVNTSLSYTVKPDANKVKLKIAELLSANGFTEIMANSLSDSNYYKEEKSLVEILNPLSNELNVLRQSLLFGGLEAIARNINHRQENLKLFEFGNCYFKTNDGYSEQHNLSLLITGRRETEQWNSKEDTVDFFYIKGVLSTVFDKLGLKKIKIEQTESEHLQTVVQFKYGKKVLAVAGQVSSDLLGQFEIEQPVFFANINWTDVVQQLQPEPTQYKPLAKFPAMRRDLALLLDEKTSFAEIEQIARNTDTRLLKSVNIFDVYRGKGVEEGKKSYAVSFTFQDAERTLTDEEVDALMKKLQKTFEEKLGATLR